MNGQEKTTANTGLAKVAVQCSADTFVVNQNLVLRINICGENRHLRQAQNRCVPFYNKHPINDVNMRQIILLLLTLILMYSCKEEVYYGTSISIKNELIDTIKVILYPREEPFHFMEELTIDPDFNQSLYERKRTDLNILTLMSNVFDSILIYKGNGFFMKFSPDSSFNCNFNPYKDLSIWESEIIEGDMPTNFTNTHTITENFYFRISGANIISK